MACVDRRRVRRTSSGFQGYQFLGAALGGWGIGWIGYDAFAADVREAYVMRPLQPVAPTPVLPKPPLEKPVAVIQPAPIAPITGLECGHVKEVERDGKLVLTGFVGSDTDLAKLTDQAKAVSAAVEVTVRPWPQCELLLTLDKAFSLSNRPTAKIETAGRLTEKNPDVGDGFETTDYLKFTVTTPPYPSYLHAAYIQADGSVVNVLQPDNLALAAYPPSTKLMLGDLKGPGPKFRVGPPFGRVMLVVLASRSPVFAAPSSQHKRLNETCLWHSAAERSLANPTALPGERGIRGIRFNRSPVGYIRNFYGKHNAMTRAATVLLCSFITFSLGARCCGWGKTPSYPSTEEIVRALNPETARHRCAL